MEEALKPSPPSFAAARRRSHLDSASYRTLARLFTHCLNFSPHRPSPEIPPACEGATFHPKEGEEVEPVVENPSKNAGDASGELLQAPQSSPACEAAAFGQNGSEEEEAVVVDGGVGYSAKWPESSPVCKSSGFDRNESAEEDAVVANPSFEEFCSKNNVLCEEFGSRAELVEQDETLRSVKACLDGDDEQSVGEGLGNDDDQLLLNDMITGLSGLLDGVNDGAMPVESCGIVGGELRKDEQMPLTAEEMEELGGGIQEDPNGNSYHDQVDGDVFEEGEIEGAAQDLDEALDSDFEDEVVDDEKLEDFVSRDSAEKEAHDHDRRSGSSLSDGHLMPQKKGNGGNSRDAQLRIPRLPAVSYEEVVDWNETPLPVDEAPKADKKRKRVLTEERKAKKKKAKRIKRAQQERAQGVKRLRLQPVIKPKVVQYCRFYLQGKCQQGDLCNYSHDTTPLTMSKPCTHFARGSCLKGDDCPYDHELSKYPCHNFMENGMCGRGDKCKFSHVMPTAKGPSSTPDAKKSDIPLTSEKADFRKQINGQKISMVPNGEPRTAIPTRPYSILKNLADISVSARKAPPRIPKGVRFLSFGKGKSDSSSPHQDNLPIEKHSITEDSHQQTLGGLGAEGHKIAEHTGQKSFPRLDDNNTLSKAILRPSFEPKKTSLASDSAATSGSRSIQDEVSEASRILQEFLFGAGS